MLAVGQSLPGSGNSLTFNGSSTYINCGTADRGITNHLTVEAWIKTTSISGQFVVTKYSNSLFSESGFEFGTSLGRALINGRAGQNSYFTSGSSTTNVSDGRWHHIAGQIDGSIWRIYVDGVLENSTNYNYTGGDLRTPEPMTIGTYTYLTNFYFNGDIDEVRVWRTPRTQAEIQDNMCRKFAVAPADLVAYYRLDQTSGSIATDHGSVPTPGTLTSFSAAVPWHLSGAPLGDASANLYQNALPAGSRVALATLAGDSAIASLSAQARGLQLYAVNSAPAIAPPGTAAGYYVGVFTIGAATNTPYSLRLRPTTGPSCRNAFARASNDAAWTLPAQLPVTATSLLVQSGLYRSEHILTAGVVNPATIAGDSLICAGTTSQLTVAAPGSTNLVWNTGSTAPTLLNVGPGTYTVTINFGSGCSRVLRRTVRVATIPSLAISGDSVLCPGVNATLTANAPGATAYRWSTGATTAALPVSQAGTYSVVATYGLGCTTTAAQRTVRQSSVTAPAFTLGADTTLCEGDQLLLQGPAGAALRYQWSDGSTGRQLLVQTAGRYTLRMLADCGEQSASRAVALRSCIRIPNIITTNADAHNDLFAVEGLHGEGWALAIYNRWGRSVFQTANYRNNWGFDAAPGIYYVLLRRPATGYQYKGWLEVVR